MSIGTTPQLAAMIGLDQTCTLSAEIYSFYLAPDLKPWERRSTLVGNGQCAVLVQQASGAPLTSLWRKGPKVKGNTAVPVGTAIATFDDQGLYPNHRTGNHAALFVSVNDHGIVVLDQWATKTHPQAPSQRTIRYRNGSGDPSNDGDQFWVIVTSKIHSRPA